MSHSSSIESFPTHVLSINAMSDTRNGDKNAVVKQVRCDCFYSSEGHSQREKGQTAHKSEMMSENFEFNYFCKVFGNNLSLLLIAMWTNSAACITLKQMCNFQSAFLSFINKYALSKCLESTGLQYSNQMKQ